MASLECELARAQMKRYLAGEVLPPDLMRGLESHLKACPGCQEDLDQQKLKLAQKLSGAKTPLLDLKKFIPKFEFVKSSSDVFKTQPVWMGYAKSLGLSVALAGVLFAMSAFAKDPTRIMGRKAGESLPANTAEELNQKDESHGDPKKDEADSDTHAADDHSKSEPAVDEHAQEEPGKDEHGAESHAEPKPGKEEHADSGHAKPEPKTDEEPALPPQKPVESAPLLIAEDGSAKTVKSGAKATSESKSDDHKTDDHKTDSDKPAPKKAAESKTPAKKSASHKPAAHPRPNPPARRTTRKSTVKKPVNRKSKSSPPKASGVRVYDANGKLIR